jgi:CRP/FNR family transcriptional regulator, cyclic AMP receptor protein
MDQQAAIIAAHPFFRRLPGAYLAQLAKAARHISVPAGQRLFEEGGTARHFWLIEAGQVALDARVPGDGSVIIELLGRGDIVGLSWLQPPYQFRFGGRTTQPMQAFEFDAAAVRAACEDDPALGYALMCRFQAVTARRLQATRARLLQVRMATAC